MSGSNLEVGVQDPEMSVSVIGRETRTWRKEATSSGVISRSPFCSVRRGFGRLVENGDVVAGRVEAKVRRRLGSVTRRRTEAL